MKITVLLGNGFDVSLGIKSSYGEFYKWYCDKTSPKTHITEFRKAIKNDISRDVPDDEKTWADFEVGLGQYTSNFTVDTVENYLDCHEDAQENIRAYLKEQEGRFDPDEFTVRTVKNFPQSICNFYEEVTDLEKIGIASMLSSLRDQDREISFVTFNYTDTLERILQKVETGNLPSWKVNSSTYRYKLNQNIIHAHGTLDNFPVLGVNDESQITNQELLGTPQFKEFLIKAENVKALGQLWHNKAEEQINSSKIVCILGMSLGQTDARWWQKLVQWLKSDGARRIILYWYVKNHSGNILSRRQIRCINEAKEKLLSYSVLTADEVASLKSRIHVVINTSKFMALERGKEEVDASKAIHEKDGISERLDRIEEKVNSQPRIFTSEEEPKDFKEGDIWLKPVSPL